MSQKAIITDIIMSFDLLKGKFRESIQGFMKKSYVISSRNAVGPSAIIQSEKKTGRTKKCLRSISIKAIFKMK